MSTTFASHHPATGEIFQEFANLAPDEVAAIVADARSATLGWQSLGTDGRKKVLLAWCASLTKRIDEAAEIIAAETGKPVSDAALEVALAISHLSWAAKNAKQVLRTQTRSSGLLMINMHARVERSPYGVVGVIGPWNYPLYTPMGSISYALAAGNTVVFKPSEFTPGVGVWLANSFAAVAPFPHIFTTITGLPGTGKALTESAIDKISFTGSTNTAKKVAASCINRMVPYVLECGGKDPVIIAADANLDQAAENTLWSAMANSGQSCIGAERVYVVESVAAEFIKKISDRARKIVAGADYGPITMPAQLGIIQSHIDDAAARGASFAVGDAHSVAGPYVSPIIMLEVPEESSAVQDETFGPTLTIKTVKNLEEAITLANATRYGLGATVWSKRHGHKIATQLRCGMVSINSVFSVAAIAAVPFGGIKDSGVGRVHGPEGLFEFTYARSVVAKRFSLPISFTTFDRTKFTDRAIKTLIKSLHSKVVG